MKILSSALLVLFLTGCASDNDRYWIEAHQVQPGMGISDVVKLLGAPISVRGDENELEYRFLNYNRLRGSVNVKFHKGRVFDVDHNCMFSSSVMSVC